MKFFLFMCSMGSALLGMELEGERLINTDSKDLIAIDIDAPSFKESFKDAVNKGDELHIQQYLEKISKKFIPNTQLDPLVAGYLQQYFSLRSDIQQKFTHEYLLGVEESKQPQIIQRLMKLTKMRLHKAAANTLEIYEQEQLKQKRNEKKILCCMGSIACLAITGFGAFAATMIISINNA